MRKGDKTLRVFCHTHTHIHSTYDTHTYIHHKNSMGTTCGEEWDHLVGMWEGKSPCCYVRWCNYRPDTAGNRSRGNVGPSAGPACSPQV